MLPMLLSLGLSLGVTLLLELAAAFLLGIRTPRDLLLVGLVNVVTNPPVVLTLNLVALFSGSPPQWYLIAALELAAWLIEACLYRARFSNTRWNPFLLSLLLNGISYFGGLLL